MNPAMAWWDVCAAGRAAGLLSPMAKPWQKLRSYLVWHVENLGLWKG